MFRGGRTFIRTNNNIRNFAIFTLEFFSNLKSIYIQTRAHFYMLNICKTFCRGLRGYISEKTTKHTKCTFTLTIRVLIRNVFCD